MTDISRIHFNHGLGDCTYFAHLLKLYTSRGHYFEVSCPPDKAVVFRGIDSRIHVTHHRSDHAHHCWEHGPSLHSLAPEDYYVSNKAACNISRRPMPDIGLLNRSMWDELCTVKLDLPCRMPAAEVSRFQEKIVRLGHPLVLLHPKGNSFSEQKNIDDSTTEALCRYLLENTSATLMVLDWDNRVKTPRHPRIFSMCSTLGHLNLQELLELISQAQLLIGIDSGPAHFTHFTNTPALVVWYQHHPAVFSLPRENHAHLVPRAQYHLPNRNLRSIFNVIESGDQRVRAEDIGRAAACILSKPIYFPSEKIGKEVLLSQFLRQCRGGVSAMGSFVDRHLSFALALERLSELERPVQIVETGTIRSQEDWGGAGYSTYLLSFFAQTVGGKLTSVDNEPAHCLFAQSQLKQFASTTKVVHSDSVQFLKSFTSSIDLLYLDSVDTDKDVLAQHALEEVQAAYDKVESRGHILLDDSPSSSGTYFGRGRLAVPWLLERSCKLVYAGHQTLLQKPSR